MVWRIEEDDEINQIRPVNAGTSRGKIFAGGRVKAAQTPNEKLSPERFQPLEVSIKWRIIDAYSLKVRNKLLAVS